MNRNYLMIIAVFTLLISCERPDEDPKPDEADIHLTKGLIAYYPFNNNSNDESGNGNGGTLVNGSALTYDENGRAVSALNCNGIDQKMVVQNNGKIRFDTTMTISFHVMPRTIKRSSIISMVDNNTGRGAGFVIGPAIPGNNNLVYSIVNNEVACSVFQTNEQVSNIDAGITLQPESWYNIICSYNKGVMKLFINGALISTRNSKDNTMHTCADAELLIGGWWNGDAAASFDGKIDEVRLYNRELNDDEINELSKSFR